MRQLNPLATGHWPPATSLQFKVGVCSMLNTQHPNQKPETLIIACGATAQEIKAVLHVNDLHSVDVTCLPAELHNRPDQIPERVRGIVHKHKHNYSRILCAYADCGTGGLLDIVLEEEGIERIPGPHCYSFFSGADVFDDFMEEEIGTFFLTDYMVRFFDTIIIAGLGLDRYPELQDVYFNNYTRLLYISQIESPELLAKAKSAAEQLGLTFAHQHVGYGELTKFLIAANATSE